MHHVNWQQYNASIKLFADQHTERETDIVTYRTTIAVKNRLIFSYIRRLKDLYIFWQTCIIFKNCRLDFISRFVGLLVFRSDCQSDDRSVCPKVIHSWKRIILSKHSELTQQYLDIAEKSLTGLGLKLLHGPNLNLGLQFLSSSGYLFT